jgi:hypothetical protein
MLDSPRKQILDPLPLAVTQLVSTRHSPTTTNQYQSEKSICRYALGFPPYSSRLGRALASCHEKRNQSKIRGNEEMWS